MSYLKDPEGSSRQDTTHYLHSTDEEIGVKSIHVINSYLLTRHPPPLPRVHKCRTLHRDNEIFCSYLFMLEYFNKRKFRNVGFTSSFFFFF